MRQEKVKAAGENRRRKVGDNLRSILSIGSLPIFPCCFDFTGEISLLVSVSLRIVHID